MATLKKSIKLKKNLIRLLHRKGRKNLRKLTSFFKKEWSQGYIQRAATISFYPSSLTFSESDSEDDQPAGDILEGDFRDHGESDEVPDSGDSENRAKSSADGDNSIEAPEAHDQHTGYTSDESESAEIGEPEAIVPENFERPRVSRQLFFRYRTPSPTREEVVQPSEVFDPEDNKENLDPELAGGIP